MDKTKNEQEVAKFIQKLKTEFSPSKIILFGSHATGTAWKQSDYDFIVVSKKFDGMHWLTRISKVVSLWDLPIDIDALPYTPEEFEDKRKNSSIVRHAVKTGKIVAG